MKRGIAWLSLALAALAFLSRLIEGTVPGATPRHSMTGSAVSDLLVELFLLGLLALIAGCYLITSKKPL